MSEKNLPIQMVLQKNDDIKANPPGGGNPKFFGECTKEIQEKIAKDFADVKVYYEELFENNPMVPAVGKIKVKAEAIAKSHKPNDLCRNCRIIGGNALDEIYIKVTKKSLEETIKLISEPPSERFRANLTAITKISPITDEEKITDELQRIVQQSGISAIKGQLKVKIFNFADDFDDQQIEQYVCNELNNFGFDYSILTYGKKIKFVKIDIKETSDVYKIASINGVKIVDFFRSYSLPVGNESLSDINEALIDIHDRGEDSGLSIGIIDGGISDTNPYLKPYIKAREVYVQEQYQNHRHGTFIASIIQYGNQLNNIPSEKNPRFSFIDIIAIPNADKRYGPIDTINEIELMEIIEEVMEKYSSTTKIWNLSLGIPYQICNDKMSDLGMFLDYIQDKYEVQIICSIGNYKDVPLRNWPPQSEIQEKDRLIAPADSVRAITVGSIALKDSPDSIVKKDEPSPFSRRGPGAGYIVKPDVVDYGGNVSKQLDIKGLGIIGMDVNGLLTEDVGTSFSGPRTVQKFSCVYDELKDKNLLLTKALLMHSARMHSRDFLDKNPEAIKYYGFGMPSVNISDIIYCSDSEVTLVFKQRIPQKAYLEMYDFPYPPSLIKNGKYYGEIGMTLAYIPALDANYGQEYCRTNIDVSFGVVRFDQDGEEHYKGEVPLECSWDEKFEQARVEHGFKWSPVKSYYRKISKGIKIGAGWKIRVDMNMRNGFFVPSQDFVLIITVRGDDGMDIYSEMVKGLRNKGYVLNNLETKQTVRQLVKK